MLKFLDGHLMGTTSSAGAAADAGGGGGDGGGAAAAAAAAAASDKGTAAQPFSFPTEKAFAEYLPDSFKNLPNFKDVKSFDGLLKQFVDTQKMVGLDKNRLAVLPAGDNDNEGYNNLYNLLGRPESADKYQVPPRADKSPYSPEDVAFQKQLLPILHEAGITQRQLATIAPKWDALVTEINKAPLAAAEQYASAGLASLKQEFGAAFDDKVALAQAALAHYGNPKLADELKLVRDGKALGDSPELMKLFAKLGEGLREDGVLGKNTETLGGALSPAEARQQIEAKYGDKDFMARYKNPDKKIRMEAVQEMQRLFEFAYPEESGQA